MQIPFKLVGVGGIGFLLLFSASQAQALMTSPNFRIWADAVSSGGNRSTSAGFIATDTLGETPTGEDSASANFFLEAGLPAIFEEPVLLSTIGTDTATLSPNPLTTSTVSTATYTLTVSTNAQSGYTAQVLEDGDFRVGAETINDVTDGSVTPGVEEYGIRVTGTDAAFADDRAISGTPLTIASRTDWVTNTVATITHRAAISGATGGASYSHTVFYIIVGNF